MGLIDFVKDAGEKLFGIKSESKEEANREAATALTNVIKKLGFSVTDLRVSYDDGTATLEGKTPSQAEREKIVLLVGNTSGVARVNDLITVEKPEPEAILHTVQQGDSLSKIAKIHYGDASKYMMIYEANTPMLKDPNKIYVGQVLRIPPMGK
jgi:nucleoid-associated protein YgaU